MILGLGLGITARGLVTIHGQQMSPTTTTPQSFVWKSMSTMDQIEGSGMMRNVPKKNIQFVIKVGKTDSY